MISSVRSWFERGRWSPIGELRARESELLKERKADKELSAKWRAPAGKGESFINDRNKELIPIKIFADHKNLADDDAFRLMPKGDPVDAQVRASSEILNLQITIADLDWENDAHSNPGYQQRLQMELLNQRDVVIGHGPFRRFDGKIVGPEVAYSNEERLGACRRGLIRALQGKATHDGRGCWLLIYARDYYIQTIDSGFEDIAKFAVASFGIPPFDRVCIMDSEKGCFVELPEHGRISCASAST